MIYKAEEIVSLYTLSNVKLDTNFVINLLISKERRDKERIRLDP